MRHDFSALWRQLRPHRGVLLLGLLVLSATTYVACSGNDPEFGSGVQETGADTNDKDTDEKDSSDKDTKDDAPSTND